MKAQNRIITEILLFAIGIILTSYVIISFGGIEDSVNKITLMDDFSIIADYVTSAVIKVSETDNSAIRLSIPVQLSRNTYKIQLKGNDENTITISSFENPELKLVQHLYKIRNKIILSEVISTAKHIKVVNNNNEIMVRRL